MSGIEQGATDRGWDSGRFSLVVFVGPGIAKYWNRAVDRVKKRASYNSGICTRRSGLSERDLRICHPLVGLYYILSGRQTASNSYGDLY